MSMQCFAVIGLNAEPSGRDVRQNSCDLAEPDAIRYRLTSQEPASPEAFERRRRLATRLALKGRTGRRRPTFASLRWRICCGLNVGFCGTTCGVPLAAVVSQVSGRRPSSFADCHLSLGRGWRDRWTPARRDRGCRDLGRPSDRVVPRVCAIETPTSPRCCVIDREAGGRDNLVAEALDLRSLFTISELQQSREINPARL